MTLAEAKAEIEALQMQLAEAKRESTVQERERAARMVERVHQLEKQVTDMTRERDRLYRSLGMKVFRDAEEYQDARKLTQAEFYEQYHKPLSNEEIRSLSAVTLHGPLPNTTMSRVLSTLSEVPMLRDALVVKQARESVLGKKASRKGKP